MFIKHMRSKAVYRTFLAVVTLGLLWTEAFGAEPELKIHSAPSVALYGAPFSLKVSGLQPNERATVKAVSRDARKIVWESQAVFEADETGEIALARMAPKTGDYAEADIFGLLWSMKPKDQPSSKHFVYLEDEVNGWTVDFTVTDSAAATASTRFRCVYQMPGQPLVRVPLEKNGLYGFLYHPAQGGPFPGVLILGGSNGGLYEWLAQAFASHGFAALTLAYFSYRDLPAELVEIPLEQFQRAVAWMKGQPAIRPDRIGIAGGSKGGELALLLASAFNDFQAVVAWTPAAHAWEGLSRKFFSPDYVPVSSWTLGGLALPFIPIKASPEDKAREMKGELASFLDLHRDSLAQSDPAAVEKAAIPVEKIRAPILLVSGTDDQTWPANEFCDSMEARLKKAGFVYEIKRVVNEGGGHPSFLPWFITARTSNGIDGGTPRANVRGGYRSWAETIAFLHRHLNK